MQMIKPFSINSHNERPEHIERDAVDVIPSGINVQGLKADWAFTPKRTVLAVVPKKVPSANVVAVPFRPGRFRWGFWSGDCIKCIRLRSSQLG